MFCARKREPFHWPQVIVVGPCHLFFASLSGSWWQLKYRSGHFFSPFSEWIFGYNQKRKIDRRSHCIKYKQIGAFFYVHPYMDPKPVISRGKANDTCKWRQSSTLARMWCCHTSHLTWPTWFTCIKVVPLAMALAQVQVPWLFRRASHNELKYSTQ